MKKIFLLTGPINSGKSTRLFHWSQKQNNIAGIICLRDSGKRELYSVLSNSFQEFEVDDEIRQVLKIGKFKFLSESFEWAELELQKSIDLNPDWIVIDEVGPLELTGKGFDDAIKKLTSNHSLNKTNLILVVRDTLVDKVIKYYNWDRSSTQIVDFI